MYRDRAPALQAQLSRRPLTYAVYTREEVRNWHVNGELSDQGFVT